MTVFDALALLIGVLVHLIFPQCAWWVVFGLGVCCVLAPCRLRYVFFCVGFFWASLFTQFYLSSLLPLQYEMQPLLLKGEVVSFPVKVDRGENFLMKIDTLSTLKNKRILNHGQVFLHADNAPVEMGSHYACLVKLLRVHGLKNPGSLNAEWLAMANQTSLHGTVLKAILLHRGHSLRALLHDRLLPLLPNTPQAMWLMALMLGDHSRVDAADWSVLSNTGTNHLMVVGGLHLGMVALGIAALMHVLWRRSARLMHYLNAPMAAAVGAWFFTVFYAYLAGFGISTQRACLMLSVLTATLLLRRKVSTWQAFALALVAVLIMNPFSSLTLGFWLSFVTIALIIYGAAGRPYLKKSHLSFRLQWVLGLGLLPLMLYLFQSASMVSSLANIIAIPWLTFTILPLCLLALILCFPWPLAAKGCLWLAGQSLHGLWFFLNYLSQSNALMIHHALPSLWALSLVMVGVLLLLSPRGTTARALGLVCLLPAFFTPSPHLLTGEFKLAALDVGQGLSVVIETKNHLLVYDAGGHLHANDDKGERVVLPYLQHENRANIDILLISHGDNDHAGGADYLLHHTRVKTLLTSVPEKFPAFHAIKCSRGQQWVWDSVRFSVLSPSVTSGFAGNNASCVLMVDNGRQRVLLPGDIESPAEFSLLQSGVSLKANVLIAPHHGSNTSSTPAFIAAVSPDLVIYSTGYRNHYGLPHPVIVKRYRDAGVLALNTVDVGAIELTE
jgi:competence protein ComEC